MKNVTLSAKDPKATSYIQFHDELMSMGFKKGVWVSPTASSASRSVYTRGVNYVTVYHIPGKTHGFVNGNQFFETAEELRKRVRKITAYATRMAAFNLVHKYLDF